MKIGLFCFYRNDFPNFVAEIGDTFRAMINFVRIKYPRILIFSEIVALCCFCKSSRNNFTRTDLFIKISFFCIHSSLNNIGRKSGSSANTFSYNFLQLIFSNLVYQCVENCFYYLLEVLLRVCWLTSIKLQSLSETVEKMVLLILLKRGIYFIHTLHRLLKIFLDFWGHVSISRFCEIFDKKFLQQSDWFFPV